MECSILLCGRKQHDARFLLGTAPQFFFVSKFVEWEIEDTLTRRRTWIPCHAIWETTAALIWMLLEDFSAISFGQTTETRKRKMGSIQVWCMWCSLLVLCCVQTKSIISWLAQPYLHVTLALVVVLLSVNFNVSMLQKSIIRKVSFFFPSLPLSFWVGILSFFSIFVSVSLSEVSLLVMEKSRSLFPVCFLCSIEKFGMMLLCMFLCVFGMCLFCECALVFLFFPPFFCFWDAFFVLVQLG